MTAYISKVEEAGLRAKSLVQQILTFGRQSSGEPEIIDPVELVDEATQMLRPSLPETITIVKKVDDHIHNIFVDPTQFNQVILNLCTNAFHAMEKTGGTLNICLANVAVQNDNQHGSSEMAGNYVKITIGDTGQGIPGDRKNKVFDPYFTTKEAGKGTGMGLSIVHGIITNAGGFLKLESSLGKGTEFHLFFPACHQQVKENQNKESNPVKGGERILFIDDEEFILQVNAEMLTLMGYQVTTCSSGVESLNIFEKDKDAFDLVITDQTMIGLTGAELAKNCYSFAPIFLLFSVRVTVLLLTVIINREKAEKIGIKGFAFKPVPTEDMTRLIRKILDNSIKTITS